MNEQHGHVITADGGAVNRPVDDNYFSNTTGTVEIESGDIINQTTTNGLTPEPGPPTGFLNGVDQFFAGMGSALTFGLTDRLRESMYGETATRNQTGPLYVAGQITGTVLATAISFGNPCAMGNAAARVGFRSIQVMQAAGGVGNAVNNLAQGNYVAAAFDIVGVFGNVAAFRRACFAAGTPLLTPTGAKPIEWLQVGDLVLARAEHDPNGPVEAKVVEEVFRNFAAILHLHVGGQLIRTTAEHPFWVKNLGWIQAGELRVGDLLCGQDGRWTAVEDLFDTGDFETVYNLRVADHHTYFVGGDGWGFAVWAHNVCVYVGHASSGASGILYVGITNNITRRAQSQMRRLGIEITAIPGIFNLPRAQARNVEQALIHLLAPALNRINSISPLAPDYVRRLAQGRRILRQLGFPGF